MIWKDFIIEDVYQPPQNDLRPDVIGDPGNYGSIDKALSGDYELNFDDMINEAWQMLETSRRAIKHNWFTFFGILIAMGFIMMISLSH